MTQPFPFSVTDNLMPFLSTSSFKFTVALVSGQRMGDRTQP